jgi:hypothetical protein
MHSDYLRRQIRIARSNGASKRELKALRRELIETLAMEKQDHKSQISNCKSRFAF